jgi:pimeloyl-ACP methyl ester carboxylesterase
VVLLHGFLQTRNLWTSLAARLEDDGHPVLALHLGSSWWRYNTRPVRQTAQRVAHAVHDLVATHQLAGVHVIGHSMGGLIARAWVQAYGGDAHVRSITTLGTPHRGTPTALVAIGLLGWSRSSWELLPRSSLVRELAARPFPADVPLLSIASRHDLVCPWRYSQVDAPHTNLLVAGLGHSELAWDEGVYGHLRAVLDRA